MKNIIFTLLALILSLNVTAQFKTVNINIAKPKVKAVDNKENLRNTLNQIITESLLAHSDFVTVVERDDLEFINEKRKKLRKEDNPRVGAAIMTGANYILESKVSDVNFESRKQIVKKTIKEIHLSRHLYTEHVKYTIDFELVNIETGEIDFQYRMNIDGLGYELKKDTIYTTKDELLSTALLDSEDCLRSVLHYMVSSITLAKCPVVQLLDIKKDKAKSLYIEVGPNNPFRKSRKFDIIKSYVQDVGGEKIEREEKIGEAKFDRSFAYVSKCDISKGKKEVFAAYQSGAKLHCIPQELKYIPTCELGLTSTKRSSLHKAYRAAAKSDSDPDATTITLKGKDKPKSTKKVQRKSGN